MRYTQLVPKLAVLCLVGVPSWTLAQLLPAQGGQAGAAGAVGEYLDPVAGFAVRVPSDWDMTTGMSGERCMGINLRSVGSLRAPVVIFTRVPASLDAAGQALGMFVKALDGKAQADVRRSGRGDFEVITTIGTDIFGPVGVYGVAREEAGTVYTLIAMAPMSVATEFKQEIDQVMGSFRIVGRPVLRAFREPSERAFTLELPRDWSWEGGIYRDAMCPGAFVWTARNADGSAGAFQIEPGYWQTPWRDSASLAQDIIPQKLTTRIKGLQDLRLAEVEALPRPTAHLSAWFRSILVGTTAIPTDRARVDYSARIGNTPVRIRVDTYLNYYPLQMVTGWEASQMAGAWAPENRFEEIYPVARGVRDSLRVDRKWNELQMATVAAVLKHRKQVFARAADQWDGYIRGEMVITDPETGDDWDVPRGPGKLFKDPDGRIWRVPEGADIPASWHEIHPQGT